MTAEKAAAKEAAKAERAKEKVEKAKEKAEKAKAKQREKAVGECVERLVKRLEADQAKEEKAEKAERAAILKAAADEERALKVQQAAERKEAEVERKAAEAAQAATELAARRTRRAHTGRRRHGDGDARGAYLCRSPCAGAGSRGSLRALRPVDSPSLGRVTTRRPAPAWLCCAAPGRRGSDTHDDIDPKTGRHLILCNFASCAWLRGYFVSLFKIVET